MTISADDIFHDVYSCWNKLTTAITYIQCRVCYLH